MPSRPRTARMPRPKGSATRCRPMPAAHAGRARSARQGAGSAEAAGGRHRRRRQGLDQARPARATSSPRSTRWSSAAAWPTPSCSRRASPSASRWPSATWPTPRARILAKAEAGELRDRAAGRRRRGAQFEADAPSHAVRRRRGPGRRHDPRCRPAVDRARQAARSTTPRRWSGTARSAPSRCSRSTTARSTVARHAAERTKAGKLVSVAGGGDTVAALNARGRRRPIHLRLDRRRRLPGMAGGQGAAGRRGVADKMSRTRPAIRGK